MNRNFTQACAMFSVGAAVCWTVPATAKAASIRFDIAAGDLSTSLRALAQVSGQQIAFSAAEVRGKSAPAVRGTFTIKDAVDRVLAGTGLRASFGRSGVVIVKPNRLATSAAFSTESENGRAAVDEGAQVGGDIVVTAQRRNERLSEVPIAVTAISGKTLDDQRIQSLQEVARITPGLTVAAFNFSNPTISIRGAANTFSQIGVDKPVAVVIDDVFVTRVSAFSFNLFDLDSVEVLRGPQGTLFGRNVTGGAVVLRTVKPQLDRTRFAASATYGNFNDVELNALVSGPVNDKVAAKAVVSYLRHDGFGRDRITGASQDNPESMNARAQLRLAPSDGVDNILSVDYSYDTNGGRTLSSNGIGDDGDRRTSELGVPQSFERRIWGVANNLNLSVLGGNLTSITAYRKSRAAETYSSTGVYWGLLTTGTQGYNTDQDNVGTFTQELRYTSPKWDFGDFIAGVFYLKQDGRRQLYTRSFAARTGLVTAYTLADQHVETESYSGFIDGSVNLPFDFKLTAGGRYTHDRKYGDLVRSNLLGGAGGFSTGPFSASFEKFTPRVVLSWKPVTNVLLYGSWTRGFTSGGFNSEATTIASATTPFRPETVRSYEIGLKGSLFNNRLSTAIAAYDERYTDKQEFVFNTTTRIGTILNASSAHIRGIEAELTLRPVRGLTLTGTYAFLDATYSNFVVPGVLNNTGNPLPLSPRNKGSAVVSYEVPINSSAKLIANANYTHTESFYTGATKDPNLFIRSYDLVNANVGIETSSGFRVSVWGKNLFDKEYLLTPSTAGVLSEYLAAPRTYGVTLGFKY